LIFWHEELLLIPMYLLTYGLPIEKPGNSAKTLC
jgi:hypothetical protein